jgi:hypothetical protein
MQVVKSRELDCGLLFFIIIYLLLFYDNSCVGILATGRRNPDTCGRDPSVLFFILLYLELFYK